MKKRGFSTLAASAGKVLEDNRGQIVVVAALAMFFVMLAIGFTADLGRALVVRSRLAGALDATALAGALSGERYIRAEVQGGYWDVIVDAKGRKSYLWRSVSDAYTGRENDFSSWYAAWRARLDSGSYRIVERWGIFKSNVDSQARTIFDLNTAVNLPKAQLEDYRLDKQEGRGVRPEVTAAAAVSIPTVLLKNFGLPKISVRERASAFLQLKGPESGS
mgnify:CR=1 FL=1